jgi:hypothetical protein
MWSEDCEVMQLPMWLMSGYIVVLVSVVVVRVFAGVRCRPVIRNSYVLREGVGVWGCALFCVGGVVRVVVVVREWYAGIGVGVAAIVRLWCVGVSGGLGIYVVAAMFVWCDVVVVVVVVVCCFR